ncbi:MAG TPA: acyl-CoA dehydrogenase family protein [Galbitalea sp.]|jgi:alkylation response protein AidB-like acyl-CoA dehydrogenase
MKRQLFDPAHDAYRSRVREFLEREVVPKHPDWEREGIVSRELYTGLGALGALSHGIPSEYGGTGVDDFRYNAILIEEGARAGVSDGLVGPGLTIDIIAPYLVSMGTDEQKKRWLPGVTTGDVILGIAMTEPGTGSDLAGIQTRAVRDGDEWVVSGTKKFIGNGMNADLLVAAVRTGEDRHAGLSLLLIPTDSPGFERVRNLSKIGLPAHNTTELAFHEVRVPAENLLGAEGGGFRGLTGNLAQERVTASVMAVSAASAALDLTVDYVRRRRAFDAPIGSFQNTRFRIAEMATEIDIAQAFVDRCILALNEGDLTPVDAAKAKWWTTELRGRVVDTALQLHGGIGYLSDTPIARAWLDARADRIFAGSTEIMKDLIGRSMKLDRLET